MSRRALSVLVASALCLGAMGAGVALAMWRNW